MKTLKEVAEFFGVHHDTVKKAWRASGMPGSAGAYPLPQIVRWREERLHQEKQRPVSDDERSPAALELQQLQIKVAREKLKLRREAGELVARDAVRATVDQIFHRVRARLEAIPEEVSASLPPDIRTDQLVDWQQKLRLVLREMEGWAQ